MLCIRMSIDQRGLQVGVTKPLGNQRKVHAMLVKVHGPGMTPKMRMDALRDLWAFGSGAVGVFLHHKPYGIIADRLTDTFSFHVK